MRRNDNGGAYSINDVSRFNWVIRDGFEIACQVWMVDGRDLWNNIAEMENITLSMDDT